MVRDLPLSFARSKSMMRDWRIGNYQILEEIGRGGMGVIYRARQRLSHRIVALKRILSYQADSQETLVRFRREAEAAASLDHPNILPIYEVSESDDGLPFFSMKFAAGGSLQDAARALRNDPRGCVTLMAKVTRAVQFAHLARHPASRSQTGKHFARWPRRTAGERFRSGQMARHLQRSHAHADNFRNARLHRAGASEGTRETYARSRHLQSWRVLFDLFTGRTPFLGEHALAVIKQAAEKPAPKLRTLAPAQTATWKPFARNVSSANRKRAIALPAIWPKTSNAGSKAGPSSRAPFPARRIWRWSKRNPKLAAATVAAVVSATTAVLLFFSHNASPIPLPKVLQSSHSET